MRGGQEQTVLDLVLQGNGSMEEAWELAKRSGLGVTDSADGIEVDAPAGPRRKRVVKQYAAMKMQPATDLTEGIGGWRVGGGEVK